MPAGKPNAWEKQDEVLADLRGRGEEDRDAERMRELREGLAETHEQVEPEEPHTSGRPRLPGND